MGRLRLPFAPALTWQTDGHVLICAFGPASRRAVRAQRRTPCPSTRPAILSARSAAEGVPPMTWLDRTLSSRRANALISHGYARASESITGYRRRG
ncbi:hypothetical protein DN412_00410 [Cupriavidus lacunae]|uniref:Uncharacterized protein n=1 Tax=Cupriavidus lacunae TaxID=2666307 RepID=A0A370P2G1_9BURK|nr:hypothetical protein DN412_00410 [Cupriavidus lacunae]